MTNIRLVYGWHGGRQFENNGYSTFLYMDSVESPELFEEIVR